MSNRTVSVNLVANIGQYVGGMNTAAAATMRLGESATASTKKAQSGFDLAGKSSLIMGAAVVGGMAMAISKSMDFEKSMSAVGAATQATGSTLLGLRDAAMKAGADTAYSATEAADAITEMGKAGVSAKDIMGGGLSGALSLAAAGQIDVAEAAGIASTAMTQFSLSGKDLPHVADLLAAGAGKAMGSVDDLGQALNQAGLIASASGLSIEETTGTLAAFASAGLLGSDAGTSMKTMLQKLQAPSKESAEVMSELGINMYDANGNMLGMAEMAGQLKDHMSGLTQEQRNAALATIFGSDAVRAANVLYKEGATGIADWTQKVNDAGYAQRQAADLTDNLAGDLERLGGAFDTLMIDIGSGSQGPLRGLVQMLTDLVDGAGFLVGAFSAIPTPVLAAVAAFTAMKLLSGPMTGFLTTMHEKAVMGAVSLLDIGRSAENAKGALSGLAGSFTPVNMGIGSAVALLPAFVQLIKGVTQNSADASAGQRALADALKATNGVIDESSRKAAQQQLVSEGLVTTLKAAGVSSKDAIDGLLGNAAAQDRVNTALKDYIAQGVASGDMFGKQVIGANEAQDKYLQLAEALGMSKEEAEFFADAALGAADATSATGAAAEATVPQVDAATQALTDWLGQLQQVADGFVEPLSIYQGLLSDKQAAEQASAQATADATSSSKDSWKDYADAVEVSLGEYATALQTQLDAQANWRTNLGQIAQWAGVDVATHLANMGAEGVGIVAQMADGSTEEAQRLREQILREIQMGGGEWTADMGNTMRVMEAIGADGAGKTVQGIAAALNLGADEVRAIVAQYGINMAEGINPLLGGLGKPKIFYNPKTGAHNTTGTQLWSGGYTGDGGKYEPKGIVHGGEYVLTKEQTSRLGIDRIEEFANNGYANGGFVTAADVPKPRSTAPYGPPISTAGDATMQKGFDEVRAWMQANVGTAGAGPVGGAWGSLWQLVHSQIPQARMNSTFRPGDPGYHGRGKAIDFGFGAGPGGAGSAGLASINRLLHDQVGRNLAELIYDGIGDDRPDLKNGKPLTYSAATRAAHRNHVHAAVYHDGTDYVPQTGWAYLERGEAVIPARANPQSREFSGGGGGASGGSGPVNVKVEARVFVGNREITDIARVEATAVMVGALETATSRGGYNP